MSTLTKVFIVLAAVLAIALSTLVIAANGMSHSWKKSAEEWRAAALAGQAQERAVAVQATLTHEQDLDRVRRLSAEVERLKTEQLRLTQSVAEKEADLAQIQNQASSLTANVTGLRETLEVVNAQFSREQEFNRKIASRNSELERRNIDLNDRTKELTTSLAMANAQVRALQQQIASIDPSRPSAGLTAPTQIPGQGIVESNIPTVRPSPVASVTTPIRGSVTAIRGNIVSISVGDADGVAAGMRFLVYRPNAGEHGPLYLGTLQVSRVEANQAAGTLIRTNGDIRVGDRATDEASFAMRE